MRVPVSGFGFECRAVISDGAEGRAGWVGGWAEIRCGPGWLGVAAAGGGAGGWVGLGPAPGAAPKRGRLIGLAKDWAGF